MCTHAMGPAVLSSQPLRKGSHVPIYIRTIVALMVSAVLSALRNAAMRIVAAIRKRPAVMVHQKTDAAAMRGNWN